MQETSAVSRPAWVSAMNALTGTGGATRKSPVEIFATAASVVTHSTYAEAGGQDRAGRLGRWTDGVAAMRGDRVSFASYWGCPQRASPAGAWPGRQRQRPAFLGPSSAIRPRRASAPRARGRLCRPALRSSGATGRNWRVLNLSVSGALMRDLVAGQYRAGRLARPRRLRRGRQRHHVQRPGQALQRPATLFAAVPDKTVMLDLPLPTGFWWIVGRMSVPYITRIDRVVREVATERRLRVAEGRQFTRPGPASSPQQVPPEPGRLPRLDPGLLEALPPPDQPRRLMMTRERDSQLPLR